MKYSKIFSIFFIIFSTPSFADFEEGGAAYMRGDYETAAAEFIPLAERGDHRAMYALGSMYSSGQGVEKNLKKAFELFNEAAKNGRADAMYKLGIMYEEGIEVEKNYKKALRLYQKSSKKGYPLSQYRFGLMYEKGLGLKPDPINAYAWMTVAGHYFIYEVATADDKYENEEENKRQLLLFQNEEKERILNEIINHLQSLKKEMTEEDIAKTREKVIQYSKYRKKYNTTNVKNLKIDSQIENLFLPDTLY